MACTRTRALNGSLKILSMYFYQKLFIFLLLDIFAFSNLYTSTPHSSLKRVLVSLIKEAYRVRDSIL